MLEKTLESPLDCKEIQPVHPKGDQSWVFIGRTNAEAETPMLWPPDAKNWLIGEDLMLGKIEGGRSRRWQKMRWLDASRTWCTWVWVSSRSWWWTGRPGVLHSIGSQRSGQDSETELNWPSLNLSADNFSDQLSIPGIQDKEYNFRLKEWAVYWKQNQGPRVLHWMPRNFYLSFMWLISMTFWFLNTLASLTLVIFHSAFFSSLYSH